MRGSSSKNRRKDETKRKKDHRKADRLDDDNPPSHHNICEMKKEKHSEECRVQNVIGKVETLHQTF